MQPLDLVDAAPWRQVLFTTYALSLSFFESVILDRLIRGGGRNALIFADPEGVRAGLSERGARRVGREYELEPVVCLTGVFHPKVSVFAGPDDCHLLVGSGNLTFGGWGANLEVVEHLHPSFAADAFLDAADFFELMTIADNIRMGVPERFISIAEELRRSTREFPRNGNVRLIHGFETPIAEQLVNLASDLGGASRITIVSPFFDRSGSAVTRLSEQLECSDVRLHAHPTSPVRGLPGTNWPAKGPGVPVLLEQGFGPDERHLHAKCFEIICRRGRLVVSGSANATQAALRSGNVEASVVRIQRDVLVGWRSQPAPLPLQLPDASDSDEQTEQAPKGVLRASLDGDRMRGTVLVPIMSGGAHLGVVTASGLINLGLIELGADGSFDVLAPDLESLSWSGGRMVLRVEQESRIAEGFVSVAAASEIIRRAGPLAPRILAMLAGTETPADVAAIMSWFHEDPRRAMPSVIGSTGAVGGPIEAAPIWVPASSLHGSSSHHEAGKDRDPGQGEPAWQRAMALLRAAFARPRGPWKSGTEEDDEAEDEEDRESDEERRKRLERDATSRRKAYAAFVGLLDTMLAPENEGTHARTAFSLGNYLADRLRPEPALVRPWLQRIINCVSSLDPKADGDMISAALLLRATDDHGNGAMQARKFLLRHHLNPAEVAPELDPIPGFVAIFRPEWNAATFLQEVCGVRTPGEQVRSFLAAADQGGDRTSFPLLIDSPYRQRLIEVLDNPEKRARIHVVDRKPRSCPKCHIELNGRAINDLNTFGVAGCCRLILNTEA